MSAGGLEGWTVVVTRPESEQGRLSAALRSVGALPILRPSVQIEPFGSIELRSAIQSLDRYDWIVFTSARAVDVVLNLDPRPDPEPTRVGAVGPATARALSAGGWEPDLVGAGDGAALGREMLASGVLPGDRVLFPCSDRAVGGLPNTLRQGGVQVEAISVYRTRPRIEIEGPPGGVDRVDAVTFTSPSAVDGWFPASRIGSSSRAPPITWPSALRQPVV